MDGPERSEHGRAVEAGVVGRRGLPASTAVWGCLAVAGCVGRPWAGDGERESWTEHVDDSGELPATVELVVTVSRTYQSRESGRKTAT
ncbi:hypothetical protein AArcSl_0544 [Halalkaliarchaeum desulfuricum]|uniref:Uncharacterized protein n=1 Tax=Halalkaliarchaeum desulfuricum TaxID=2055893 RepID=A0A343TGH3_9EURY|nr:hypothetical protein [Halalkaliarchaeum desulfuricum]AUX08195.1 hypothetical protein AArcSl_0544 [Halalkaliarchaeum desulfuricum]